MDREGKARGLSLGCVDDWRRKRTSEQTATRGAGVYLVCLTKVDGGRRRSEGQEEKKPSATRWVKMGHRRPITKMVWKWKGLGFL